MGFKPHHIIIFALSVLILAVLCIPPAREQSIMLAQRSRTDAAIECLFEILEKNPEDMRSLKMIIPLLVGRGDALIALNILERYEANNPGDRWAENELVSVYRSAFYYDKALGILKRDENKNYRLMVELLVEKGDLPAAISTLRAQLKSTDSDYEKWQDIETYQQWSMNISGVVEAMAALVTLRGSRDDLTNIIEVYQWRGELNKALVYAQQLENHPKRSIDDERLLSSFYVRARKLPLALSSAKIICERKEATSDDWQNLAYLYAYSGEYAAALDVIDNVLVNDPHNETMLWMGSSFAEFNNDLLRKIKYVLILAERQKNGFLYRGIAALYIQLQMPQEAENIYRLIIKQKLSGSSRAFIEVIALDLKQKKRATAYADIRFFEKRFPPHIRSLEEIVEVSFFYDRLNLSHERDRLLVEAQKRGSSEALYIIADGYRERGLYSKGLDLLDEGIPEKQQQQKHFKTIRSTFVIERYWGSYGRSSHEQYETYRKQALQSLYDLRPFGLNNTQRENLIDILVADGKYHEAKKEYALLKITSVEIDMRIADAAIEKDELVYAQEIIAKIKTKNADKDLWRLDAALAEKAGDYRRAIKKYKGYFAKNPRGKEKELQEAYFTLIRKVGGVVPRPVEAKHDPVYQAVPFSKMTKREQLLTKAYRHEANTWDAHSVSTWYDTQVAYSRAIEHIKKGSQK